jgi:hypothetical protein
MKCIRYLAEAFRIPVFVTNQVRTSSGDNFNMGFTFEGENTFIYVKELLISMKPRVS